MKKALITGVTGQDGSYLSEFLLGMDYEVHGMIRRSSGDNTLRIKHLLNKKNFYLHYGNMSDQHSLTTLVEKVMPDEVYNLAAQIHVGISFEVPEETGDITGLGTLRILEAIRKIKPDTKFYQASTSELFGTAKDMQNEDSLFYPKSPYAVAKLYAYWITVNYRESYNMFACNGILFNHESPRRGDNFVTQKIVKDLVSIHKREKDILYLGNLNAKRDWGYAKDYVRAMWMMLQQDKPDDYVIATGEAYTVREFVEETAKCLGIEIVWEGQGLEEKGIDKKTGQVLVLVSSEFYRPIDVEILLGDSTKAKEKLGWVPLIKFKELVKIMVEAVLEG